MGRGDMHLLHVIFTPFVGRHPSQAIVHPCVLWLCFDLLAEGNCSANSRFKVLRSHVCIFLAIHESSLL
jgi:hypothetical protein